MEQKVKTGDSSSLLFHWINLYRFLSQIAFQSVIRNDFKQILKNDLSCLDFFIRKSTCTFSLFVPIEALQPHRLVTIIRLASSFSLFQRDFSKCLRDIIYAQPVSFQFTQLGNSCFEFPIRLNHNFEISRPMFCVLSIVDLKGVFFSAFILFDSVWLFNVFVIDDEVYICESRHIFFF